MPAWTGGTIPRLGVVRLNSINIRKRILEGSKVGSGRSLFLVSFEPDFDKTDMLLGWRRRVDIFTLHRGRDTGLGHDPQVGILTCVHMRFSLGHDELT